MTEQPIPYAKPEPRHMELPVAPPPPTAALQSLQMRRCGVVVDVLRKMNPDDLDVMATYLFENAPRTSIHLLRALSDYVENRQRMVTVPAPCSTAPASVAPQPQ